jgi:predicted AlkP superfamily pyrophosphatase or phosphodiesterase
MNQPASCICLLHRTARLIAAWSITAPLLTSAAEGAQPLPGVDHVVVIGVDGLSPDGVRKADTPRLHRLMAEGASTLHARGVMPTSSSPNWASMIMGAGPEQHGVTSNDWQPDKFEIAPTVVGPGGIFPTVFGLLRRERPGAKIACFHEWKDFARLFEKGVADRVENPKTAGATIDRAVAYIEKQKPTFLFIHLDLVDHAGHQRGHGTAAYYEAVAEADRLIGRVLDGLDAAGIAGRTIVLVTADHGGRGTKHGGSTMEEIEIPWILHGPGVVRGKEITTPVNTYDTAATLALIFGLTPPDGWIARPVRAAFAAGG